MITVTKICPKCGREFTVPKRHRWQKTCSHSCGMAGRMPWNKGKKMPPESPEIRTKKSLRVQGKKNPRWRGGRVHDCEGYILIWRPGHPKARNGRYVLEHRAVMESVLGRYLKSKEEVHHINGDREDNRKENLKLFGSKREHRVYHVEMKKARIARQSGHGQLSLGI